MKKSAMWFDVIALLIAVNWIVGVGGAGVGVHLTVLDRLRQYVPKDLENYYEYSLAGAFFPDAFYSCMDLSDAAEETHWPPFMKTAVDYWAERYGRNADEFPLSSHDSKNQSADEETLRILTIWKSKKSEISALSRLRQAAGKMQGFLGSKLGLGAAQSDDKQALRAFLYGVLTHEVADVSWHSLGIKQGLLRYMANREFDGDIGDAHFNLDTGGDMIFVRRLLLSGSDSGYLRKEWKYPKQDIIEIFKRMGYRLNGPQLDYCMLRGRAAVQAELRIAPAAFYSYAQRSPILFDNLEDYYLGGMTEMTMSARHCMYNLNAWFEKGTPFSNDSWSLCEVFFGVAEKGPEPGLSVHQHSGVEEAAFSNSQFHAAQRHSGQIPFNLIEDTLLENRKHKKVVNVHEAADQDPIVLQSGISQGEFGKSISLGKFLKHDETSIAFSSPFDNVRGDDSKDIPVGSVYVAELEELFTGSSTVLFGKSASDKYRHLMKMVRPSHRPQTYPLNARFGTQTVTINVLGRDLLVVSSPGRSMVSLFHESREVLQLTWSDSSIMYGERGSKLVGEQLLAADFDGDGLEELIIGAPYTDLGKLDQVGRVYSVGGNILKDLFTVALSREKENDLGSLPLTYDIHSLSNTAIELPPLEPDFKPNGTYAQFGSKLTKVGKDILVVGSAGIGRVYGFKLSGLKFEAVFSIDTDEPSFRSTFGGSLVAGSPAGWLAVGDSTQNTPRAQAGSVFIYKIENDKPQFLSKVDIGDSAWSFDRFGHEGTFFGNSTVLIASPYAEREKGKVWSLILGDEEPQLKELVSAGPHPYASGFGASISGAVLENGQKVVFVGMPFYENLIGGIAIYKYDEL